MKKNRIRLAKLEDRFIGNRSDVFRLSDFEILERNSTEVPIAFDTLKNYIGK